VLDSYTYLPFGETRTATQNVDHPFRFTGQWGVMRDETGLDYMRARYYSPEQGRFTEADPIGAAGDLNLYRYAGNDPVDFSDPSGLRREQPPASIIWDFLVPITANFADAAISPAMINSMNVFISQAAAQATTGAWTAVTFAAGYVSCALSTSATNWGCRASPRRSWTSPRTASISAAP
jgi:RHS repeat-associated protein